MLLVNKKNKTYRLSDIVRKVIGVRIATCIFFLFIWLVFSGIYDIYGLVEKVKRQLSTESEKIANFIISQKLVSNPKAITIYIEEYNEQHKYLKLNYFQKHINYEYPVLKHASLYKWEYIYPLDKLNQKFGYFVLYGSYINDKEVVHGVLLQAEISFIFMLLILISILPLGNSIPKKIFIDPIERLLKMIHKEIEYGNSISNNHYEPLEIKTLREDISALIFKVEEKSKSDALVDIAKQVAHDIRSPLAAINTAIMDVSGMSEQRRVMIKSASQRINDIANNLLAHYKNKDSLYCRMQAENIINPELLFVAIDSIVSEKRFEYKSNPIPILFNISDNSYSCFSNINLSAFKRLFSNLINNAIEAVGANGIINIYLGCDNKTAEIIIEDNGCGIPEELITKVMDDEFSYGKKNGAGLGLSYAKNQLEKINGQLFIESIVEIGTKVKIKLPRSDHPKWFCEILNIKKNAVVLILDDDSSIHNVWSDKFNKIIEVKLINIFKESDLKNMCKKDIDLYLIDYELLGGIKNGLELIEELKLTNLSILVTSCFEEPKIRLKCEELGIKMIPKDYVPYIPVVLKKNHSQLIFIDDDELMQQMWLFAAEQSDEKIDLSVFSSPEEFNKVLENYSYDTNIYVDSELANGQKGENYAKELYHRGFTEIYLTTGHALEIFDKMPWIRAIVGKEPPFSIGKDTNE